jgi:predicted amidophosphoribosyltransferase
MLSLFSLWFGALVRLFRHRGSVVLENLVLRQQLTVLKRRDPRPSLSLLDKLFWVAVRRFWSQWKQALIVVSPETVVRWHRTGFRLYWRLISKVRKPNGRRQTPKEVRALIFRMVRENPTWGAVLRKNSAGRTFLRLHEVTRNSKSRRSYSSGARREVASSSTQSSSVYVIPRRPGTLRSGPDR